MRRTGSGELGPEMASAFSRAPDLSSENSGPKEVTIGGATEESTVSPTSTEHDIFLIILYSNPPRPVREEGERAGGMHSYSAS